MKYNQEIKRIIENLNHHDKDTRLKSLAALAEKLRSGEIPEPQRGEEVNNHIHTFYSFSPYSPAMAVWMSYTASLSTAGIMDHDSISGALEFIEAGKIFGPATTIGLECRCDFSNTPLKGRRINNPDQKSVAYIALHGVPHTQIQKLKDYFLPYTIERNKRNSLMVERLNKIFSRWNIRLDFGQDVVPLSKKEEQGSITERHLLFALVHKLIDRFGQGDEIIKFLEAELGLALNPRVRELLEDRSNALYPYDLLGAMKSDLVESFYIDATAECPDIKDLIDFANRIGAIIAYAYLGDVGESVTGDKKSQKFEDDYLELLFETLKSLGFHAVTYMLTRNTLSQIKRIQALCEQHTLFQISGIDINSPRQSFNCPLLKQPDFRNLIDSTWALIGHEIQATGSLEQGMFTQKTMRRYPDLNTRIAAFREIGMKSARRY